MQSRLRLLGRYEQILNYVVSMDFIFFGLSASCLFVFRRRERAANRKARQDSGAVAERSGFRVPGHPITTALFVAASWLVVINTIYKYPRNTLVGMAILLAGVPVYFLWRWRRNAGDLTIHNESDAIGNSFAVHGIRKIALARALQSGDQRPWRACLLANCRCGLKNCSFPRPADMATRR